MARRNFPIIAALVLGLFTVACSYTPRSPADIRPIWKAPRAQVPVPPRARRPPRAGGPAAPVRVAAPRASRPAPPVSARAASRTVTAQRGGTVYALSRRLRADVRAIIAA